MFEFSILTYLELAVCTQALAELPGVMHDVVDVVELVCQHGEGGSGSSTRRSSRLLPTSPLLFQGSVPVYQ